MSATLTLTGKVGPDKTLTAAVFSSVISFTIDAVNNVIRFLTSDGISHEVSVNAANTVTGTKSGTTWTLTIS